MSQLRFALLLFAPVDVMAVCHTVDGIKNCVKKPPWPGPSSALNVFDSCELNSWSPDPDVLLWQRLPHDLCLVHTCLSLNNPFSVPLEVFFDCFYRCFFFKSILLGPVWEFLEMDGLQIENTLAEDFFSSSVFVVSIWSLNVVHHSSAHKCNILPSPRRFGFFSPFFYFFNPPFLAHHWKHFYPNPPFFFTLFLKSSHRLIIFKKKKDWFTCHR